MFTKALFAALLFSAMVAASPVPGQNLPITDAEWAALEANGLSQRNVGLQARAQNVPITDAEWAALDANGLSQRDVGIQARDKVLNCGKNILGTTTIGGNHVGWVPWTQFNISAQQFCSAYAGSDISMGHESSDTYPIFLTNQGNPNITGSPGNIAFAIYNTLRSPTYHVDAVTCYAAMQAPILAYLSKTHSGGGGDICYGGLHNDYEGGYYLVNGIGAFGSEVRKA